MTMRTIQYCNSDLFSPMLIPNISKYFCGNYDSDESDECDDYDPDEDLRMMFDEEDYDEMHES